jgi:hypothetical protein
LERQFENFLEYVPFLEGNEDTYSFKLLNLILSIGGHIDSTFKEMARYPNFSTNEECKKIVKMLEESKIKIDKGERPQFPSIKLCLQAFEKEYKLSERKVVFKRLPEREDIIPFRPYNPKTKAPEWWEFYNGLKHDVGINIKKASLQNALHALASAFLLNVIHIPAMLRLVEYRVVKPELNLGVTYTLEDCWKRKVEDWYRTGKFAGFVETSLFIYDYSQQEGTAYE